MSGFQFNVEVHDGKGGRRSARVTKHNIGGEEYLRDVVTNQMYAKRQGAQGVIEIPDPRPAAQPKPDVTPLTAHLRERRGAHDPTKRPDRQNDDDSGGGE